MTRLNHLVHKLINPYQISTEDAFDTVKQYWDDVTEGYWEDVDDELAEELGVTPVALAELLEVHRHTFAYANIGGNSSIRGYDHGEDWMLVMFSDGSRYLYTLKSTSRESLDYMRSLAIAGKGLNSYLTRIIRTGYAGKNIKGEIIIKPGMEQFNPMGYKRLQLIEAFRNTMLKEIETQVISQESLLDKVKSLFTSKNNSKSKVKLNYLDWYQKNSKSSLQFDEVSKPNKMVSTFFESDDFISILTRGLTSYEQAFKLIKAEINKNVNYLKKSEKEFSKYVGSIDHEEEFIKVFSDIVQKQPKLAGEVIKGKIYEFPGYGKVDLGNMGLPKENNSLDHIEALDKSDTAKIRKLAEQYLWLWFDLDDFNDDLEGGIDVTDPPIRGYIDNPKVQELTNGFKYLHPIYEDDTIKLSNDLKNMIWRTFEAIVHYMMQATGNTSNESYSFELKDKYSILTKAAGIDGLDPVAKQIMAIGMEHLSGVSAISNESIWGAEE